MKPKGMVWLVGAGPGDPDLITVKGLRCIQDADVIVYDNLVCPSLLENACKDTELIYAGKMPGKHTLSQEDINGLLVSKALAGKRVCRLKGGDPYLFGRGAEEALALVKNDVPFQVVPGVTAATGAAAYASVPLTHRNVSSSVAFVTGHEASTKSKSSLCWEHLSHACDTLVFYMGVQNLSIITARLLENGLSPDTPAAIVQDASMASQQTLVGNLRNIAEQAKDKDIRPPALPILGQVVALRESIAWFENGPLFGKTILVTRTAEQAAELANPLRQLGAEVLVSPAIRIIGLGHTDEMKSAAGNASRYDWLVFTSVNAVGIFLTTFSSENLDIRTLGSVKIAAIGPATAKRLERAGLCVDLIPDQFTAESLLHAFDSLGTMASKSFLLPRSANARSTLVDGLIHRGAKVDEVHAYRTVRGQQIPGSFLDRLERNEIDLVTFTSCSTVENFVGLLEANPRSRLLPNVRGATIGPVTTEAARANGIRVLVQAKHFTIEGLVQAIVQFVEGEVTEC